MWNPIEDLSADQRRMLIAFGEELSRVNRQINLVATSTLPHIEERHLIHSLALSMRSFPEGATVVDFGAGGGLPTIPLAIRFPRVHFVAIDAVGKKTEAVRTFARRLGLDNVAVWNGRAEAWEGPAHYAVSRATARLADLWTWFARVQQPLKDIPAGCWPQCLLALKGGDLLGELHALKENCPGTSVVQTDLVELFGRPYFEEKALLLVTADDT